MWARCIRRMIEKNQDEVRGILLRKYPAFILSNRVDHTDDIPVFAFHDVTAESLEPMFQFLAENRYKTLTADQYCEMRIQGERGQDREVMLTFDDGYKSLYTVAYPALKRYGLKAVAYIVPGMTPDSDHSGGLAQSAAELCNWKEIREIHESGVFDIQSHSMFHHSVSTSNRVVDYVKPGMNLSFLESDLAPMTNVGGQVRISHDLPCGFPVHDWGARHGDARAFKEQPSVIQACVEYVARHGGVDYFRKSNWRTRLDTVIKEARRENSHASFETEDEQRKAKLRDLQDSKREIEQRLPGKTVRHFCFPWSKGSALAVELSAEAGYISNAWGSLLPGFVREDNIPIPVATLLPPYIWRLPGKGRKPMKEILKERFSQAYRGGTRVRAGLTHGI